MKTLFTKEMKLEMLRRDCPACLYYEKNPKSCLRGMDNCILFEIEEEEKEKIPTGSCVGCPYGSKSPCVGICMKEVLSDWKKGRKEAAAHA